MSTERVKVKDLLTSRAQNTLDVKAEIADRTKQV